MVCGGHVPAHLHGDGLEVKQKEVANFPTDPDAPPAKRRRTKGPQGQTPSTAVPESEGEASQGAPGEGEGAASAVN